MTPNGQDMQNWSLYPHTLVNFHGTWTKEYRGWGTRVTPYFVDAVINRPIWQGRILCKILSLPCVYLNQIW